MNKNWEYYSRKSSAIRAAKKSARKLDEPVLIYEVREDNLAWFELYPDSLLFTSGFTRDPDIAVEPDGTVIR